MREAAVPLPRSAEIGPSLLTGLAALADIVLLRAWLGGDLLMIVIMALHLCLALAFGVLFHLFCGRSLSRTLANASILALFGPFGGPVLMIIAPGVVPSPTRITPEAQRSSARQPPRDTADELFDQICQRRRHPLSHGTAPSFLQIFHTGTLRHQQEAIAAISRGYHPDMRPALSAALASPVPALRVQAAAVYAKLRGTYGDQAKELLAGTGHSRDKAAILEVAASGFVDEETRGKLLDLAAQEAPVPRPARPALKPMPRLKRHSCGGLA